MKKITFCILISASMFAACSVYKKAVNAQPIEITKETNNDLRDGSSIEKAIITKSKTDLAAVDEEYSWLKVHYPGYRTKSQALLHKDGKSYDLLHVIIADGQQKDFYFDITAGFGHF